MEPLPLAQFGFEAEWREFAARHREFMMRWSTLQSLIDKTFIRTVGTLSREDALVGLDQLYTSCYLYPTLQAHATVMSIFTRMAESPEGTLSFDEGAQHDQVDWALVNAHGLMIHAIAIHSDHFHLGLDTQLRNARVDLNAVWTRSPAPI